MCHFQCVLRYRQSCPNHYHALIVPQERRPHNSAETNKASWQITTPSPLINDVIPTKMLSTDSEPVNSSATTYMSGSVFERNLENNKNRWGRWAAPDLGFRARLGLNNSGLRFWKTCMTSLTHWPFPEAFENQIPTNNEKKIGFGIPVHLICVFKWWSCSHAVGWFTYTQD